MKKYDYKKIEAKWQKVWQEQGVYEPNLKSSKKPPFYNLMMFPYPSAEGLHVGNMYAFTGTDIYGRYQRMQGKGVFEPIGLDGFGIHSENYAMKIGTHPMKQSKISEKRFYKQLQAIGNGFAWDERLETYDPEYYRWTQWIFIQMFKNGLAYRKKQAVNWCPSCKTVLSDEQAEGGRCERCNSVVAKKDLEQWFFKITDYAGQLLKNLDNLDWSEKVKIAQRNWIGKSEGALLAFQVSGSKLQIEVFTTRPDTLFGATYMVLAPEHELIQSLKTEIKNWEEIQKYIKKSGSKSEEERIENKEKTGVELRGIKAINPATGKEIPVWAADYVLSSYGTGAIMAVPAHDERDFEFAKKYKLEILEVVSPSPDFKGECFSESGTLKNSGKFNGSDSEEAKWKITAEVGGKKKTQYRLRDWLISRQRYWGPPIPMIYCEKCAKLGKSDASSSAKATEGTAGWYTAPEKSLPVKLPLVKDFRPTGSDQSPLATVSSFYKVRCPGCNSWAKRETDVSDTFLDSAWYYIGYLAKKDSRLKLRDPQFERIVQKWLPVNVYIGGAEHSVLHLLYVRFLALALHDMKLLQFGPSSAPKGEPFPKFRAHGLLIKEGAKMSKSKGNVVNPDEYIKNFGADTLRMYLMFLAPFEQGGDFRDAGVMGISRFLERVWKFGQKFSGPNATNYIRITRKEPKDSEQANDPNINRALHQTIKKVSGDVENLSYNTAISAMMILLNKFEDKPEAVSSGNWTDFLKLLAPFAPHITEELYQNINSKQKFGSIHLSGWPEYKAELAKEDNFALVVQVNGKVRASLEVPAGIGEKDALKIALAQERVKEHLGGKEPRRVIFVPGRLINIVA